MQPTTPKKKSHPLAKPLEHGESQTQATKNKGKAVFLSKAQQVSTVAVVAILVFPRAVAVNGRVVFSLACGRCRSCSSAGSVNSFGVEGATWVILLAGRLTRCIRVIAVVDALRAPFAADEVGYRQGVLGHVRLGVVAAETAVCQRFLGLSAWQ